MRPRSNLIRVVPVSLQTLLQAAKAGDQDAFGRLVEPHRRELHAHCYRMLGSVHDAEDALQEALLRAWRGLRRFEERSSLRSWLYRIATNTCLDSIARRPKRVLPIDYGPPADPHDGIGRPLVESVWVEPYPDETFDIGDRLLGPEARYEQRESVELAFIAALQHLPAKQRAVLLLREVLGFSAKEVADLLDTTVQSVNSALQRARKASEERLPEHSQQETLRALGDRKLQELVETYMQAWEAGDADTIVAMLTEDATLAMPPMATWFEGRAGVAAFLTDLAFAGQERRRELVSFAGEVRRMRLLPTRANGQPAFGAFYWNDEAGAYVPQALQVLTFRGGQIADITGFVSAEMMRPFGLPERLEADAAR
jgi:RNA polymerase sigma-70 factor (ECF subfamily)